MSARARRRLLGLVVAAVLAGSTAFTPALAGELTDRQGDTVNDDNDKPVDVPQADIVKSWITAGTKEILLGLQVRKPTDPATDRAWVAGDSSAQWDLDVNGDSKPDYTAELYNDDGKITGEVSRADAGDDAPAKCLVTKHSYAAEEGYTVTVDPACIGSPTSVAYQATFSYDTNPSDENSGDVTDTSPDQGMSPSVTVGK
ncbi:MAG TPA: hypothetical protein VG034_26035 [Acidimicrobiia bacterium]|jgi:hypothetical protein|nr:hypothetical protein [Acidimicrobiia bacterium]